MLYTRFDAQNEERKIFLKRVILYPENLWERFCLKFNPRFFGFVKCEESDGFYMDDFHFEHNKMFFETAEIDLEIISVVGEDSQESSYLDLRRSEEDRLKLKELPS